MAANGTCPYCLLLKAMSSIVFKGTDCSVLLPPRVHVDREDGGHLVVVPHIHVEDRTELPAHVGIELFSLSILAGIAMTNALRNNGVIIERINYQENGNWPLVEDEPVRHMHLHLYGRARDSKWQKPGEALVFPSRDSQEYSMYNPLIEDDLSDIRAKINELCKSKMASKYKQAMETAEAH